MGRGDDQYFTDPSQHEGAERVIDHWFVINRQQLFAYRLRDRVEATAATSSQDDAASFEMGLNQNFSDPYLIISLRMVSCSKGSLWLQEFDDFCTCFSW